MPSRLAARHYYERRMAFVQGQEKKKEGLAMAEGRDQDACSSWTMMVPLWLVIALIRLRDIQSHPLGLIMSVKPSTRRSG